MADTPIKVNGRAGAPMRNESGFGFRDIAWSRACFLYSRNSSLCDADPDWLMKYRKDWDLTTIPDEAISDELLKTWWARRTNQRRQVRAGGQPKKLLPCPKCGAMLGTRERRAHRCNGE
jgi:hypothetical protein